MEREHIDPADMRRRRRIMRQFRLSELSAVDRPAQVHARTVLLKRDATVDNDRAFPIAKFDFGKGNQNPKRDDDPVRQSLECRFTPFFGDELETYCTLTDDTAKRAFLSADHDQRAKMIRKHLRSIDRKEDTMMFRTLREAAEHYQRSGMSENLAKRTAASAYPELRFVTESDAVAKSETGQIQKAAATGAARRQRIEDLALSIALENKVSRQQALRIIREKHPHLFEDG